jgi:pimeloyl-ACP methyl ester carboxylesterase
MATADAALGPKAFGAGGVARAAWTRPLRARYGKPSSRRGTARPVGVDATDVSLPGPGGSTLRGWLCQPDPSREQPCGAVVMHGWGAGAADMVPIARPLIDVGVHTLLLDARCHGRSDDAEFTSMPRFAEDVAAGVRWLRDRPFVDPERILLLGHSVGAGACLMVARDDPRIAAVVSVSSMADPRVTMTRLLRGAHLSRPGVWLALRYVEHVIGMPFSSFAPLATVGSLEVPVLLVHGECDTVVPLTDAQRLASAAPGAKLLVVPGAGHVDMPDGELVGRALREFAVRTVAGSPEV